jgi:hypothetical protein
MKPNLISVQTTSTDSPLTVFPTAKIIRHPQSKIIKEEAPTQNPPDEETLRRLNAMAKQHPFCVLHRGNAYSWLL